MNMIELKTFGDLTSVELSAFADKPTTLTEGQKEASRPQMRLPPHDDAKVREVARETGFSSRTEPDASGQTSADGSFDARSLSKPGVDLA